MAKKKVPAKVQAAMDADAAANLIIKEDNSRQMGSLFKGAISRALESVGLAAEGHAKRKCPVDTGRLRNSITHQIQSSEKAVYIGSNVEYAPYVELGTHEHEAQPFLRPAASEHGDQYRRIIESSLRNA